jgi:thiol-disulfide isomerase/thioredoxin
MHRSRRVVFLFCLGGLALLGRGLPGQWNGQTLRGALETPGGELPFRLRVDGDTLVVTQGGERIRVPLRFEAGGLEATFAPYDSTLEFELPLAPADEEIEGAAAAPPKAGIGRWTKVGPRGPVGLTFQCALWPQTTTAATGASVPAPLFPLAGEPWLPSARWRLQFATDAQPSVLILEPESAAESKQPGELRGTISTTTGDYRYLAGTARGDQLRLACFDGAHAFLFHMKRRADGSLTGDFWSGADWHEALVAHPDAKAALPDAFTLTKVRPGTAIADLRYPDADGSGERRLGDLFGPVTIVALVGTWCPNCNDAAELLRSLLAHNEARGLRVVALAFEHGDDRTRHQRVVAAYREKHRVSWPMLLAGSSAKDKASGQFPVVDAVRAFPTLLFVDARGSVRSVYQGILGPADPDGHVAQWRALQSLVAKLLAAAPQEAAGR